MDTTIVADMEGQAPELEGAPKGVIAKLGGLRAGMASGEASVAMVVRMDDGSVVLAEISMRHFLAAATVFRTNYEASERGGF